MPADGHQEKAKTGEAGQFEDAAVASQQAERDGAPDQAEGEAGERVLPSHG
jgi:hypothetical protein